MSRRKANIRPDLLGEVFTDGTGYFKLLKCGTEPQAVMLNLLNSDEVEKPISFFANLVQLKPVRPIEKPKKPRADLGKHHKKASEAISPSPSKGKGEGGGEVNNWMLENK